MGRGTQIAVFVGGTLLLLATWCFLFVWVAAMTEGWLVPWDCLCAADRPPLGTWQRIANDFFEVPPGSVLPALLFIGVGGSIFAIRAARSTNRALVPWAFAASYGVFFLVQIILVLSAHRLPDLWLPQPRPPLDVGYYRTWPAILITTVLASVLFLVQCRMAVEANREAHNGGPGG